MPIGFLTGQRGLRRQRNRAIDFAESMYGGQARALQPIKDLASERATQGMGEGRRGALRTVALSAMGQPIETAALGGDQSRAIGAQTQRATAVGQGMAGIERDIQLQDLQVAEGGRQMFAETESQQKQAFATRDAAKQQANMQYEAELSARRQALGATVLGAAMAGFSPGGILNKGIGSLFNRKPDVPQAGLPELSTMTVPDSPTLERPITDEPNFDLDPLVLSDTMTDDTIDLEPAVDNFVKNNFEQWWDNFSQTAPNNARMHDKDELFNHYLENPDLFRDIFDLY